MVKSESVKRREQPSSAAVAASQRASESFPPSSCRYKGVRKRKWGKYVSEIRLPNSRERIWLGSYDTAEKAARAFDAALFCLRGGGARFNFPDDPPEIAGGRSMTPPEIQAAAARFAHEVAPRTAWIDNPDSQSESFNSRAGSPCPSVSDGAATQVDCEMTEMPLDNTFLDQLFAIGTGSDNISDFGLFPGFDDFAGDFFVPEVNYWSEYNEEPSYPETSSSLWSF